MPTAAPWLTIAEAIDYLRALAPRTAVPIHQGAVRVDVSMLDVRSAAGELSRPTACVVGPFGQVN